MDFLSFAHFYVLFGWLLRFYGLRTEALPCSNLFLWPHTSKTTVALGCNLKGRRISSTGWEARMWFVTELYQVTFPLVPITAKPSSTYHLVQKCPFASLILCRKASLQCWKSFISPARSYRNLGENGWFIARHVMEVKIFKDCRRLFKYIEEIHGRTENKVWWLSSALFPPQSATLPLPCRACKCPVAASN